MIYMKKILPLKMDENDIVCSFQYNTDILEMIISKIESCC